MEDWIVRLREHLSRKKPAKEESITNVLLDLPEPDPPLAATSTGSIAGSWERIEVYRRRAANGESVFHPLDCKTIQAENTRCNAG